MDVQGLSEQALQQFEGIHKDKPQIFAIPLFGEVKKWNVAGVLGPQISDLIGLYCLGLKGLTWYKIVILTQPKAHRWLNSGLHTRPNDHTYQSRRASVEYEYISLALKWFIMRHA